MDGLKPSYLTLSLFFAIVAAIFYLFYRLLVPFVSPLIWAVVFAIVFYPFYRATLLKVKKPGIASIIVVLMIIVLIIGPTLLLGVAFIEQASSAVARVGEMRQSGELDKLWTTNAPWWNGVVERLSPYVDLSRVNLKSLIEDSINKIGNLVMGQTTWIITNITKTAFYFVLMLFTLYYLLKEGDKITDRIRRLMPMQPDRTAALFKELRGVINATMVSGIVIALIQGFLGGIMFWAVGIPSSLFWGALMAFLSIIPLLGAFIVYIPAGIVLILTGSPVQGTIIIAVGSVIVSQIDNILRPYMVAGGTSMHPLMLFLSITGGIAMFGLVGIIIGPLIGAVFVTIIEIFEYEIVPMTNLVVEPNTDPKAPRQVSSGPTDLE